MRALGDRCISFCSCRRKFPSMDGRDEFVERTRGRTIGDNGRNERMRSSRDCAEWRWGEMEMMRRKAEAREIDRAVIVTREEEEYGFEKKDDRPGEIRRKSERDERKKTLHLCRPLHTFLVAIFRYQPNCRECKLDLNLYSFMRIRKRKRETEDSYMYVQREPDKGVFFFFCHAVPIV